MVVSWILSLQYDLLTRAGRRVRQPSRIRGWYGMAIGASVPEEASGYLVLDYKKFLHCVASHQSRCFVFSLKFFQPMEVHSS